MLARNRGFSSGPLSVSKHQNGFTEFPLYVNSRKDSSFVIDMRSTMCVSQDVPKKYSGQIKIRTLPERNDRLYQRDLSTNRRMELTCASRLLENHDREQKLAHSLFV